MPSNRARTEIAVARRRQLVASLLARNPRITRRQLQGALAKPPEEGGMLNPRTHKPYSLATIHGDVLAVKADWLELQNRDATTWLQRELVTYEELQFQAWRDGDLAEVRRVSEARRKLLGLDAPVESKVDSDVTFRVIYDKEEEIKQEPRE